MHVEWWGCLYVLGEELGVYMVLFEEPAKDFSHIWWQWFQVSFLVCSYYG